MGRYCGFGFPLPQLSHESRVFLETSKIRRRKQSIEAAQRERGLTYSLCRSDPDLTAVFRYHTP